MADDVATGSDPLGDFVTLRRIVERGDRSDPYPLDRPPPVPSRMDVVAQYLYADEPFTPPTFRLEGREHLQGVVVQSPDLTAYRELIASHLREGGLH